MTKNTNRRIGGERGVQKPTCECHGYGLCAGCSDVVDHNAVDVEVDTSLLDFAEKHGLEPIVVDSVSILLEAAKLIITERREAPVPQLTEVEGAALKLIQMEDVVRHGAVDEDGQLAVDIQYDVLDGLVAIADAESGADHEGCYDRDRSVEQSIEEAHVTTNRKYEY